MKVHLLDSMQHTPFADARFIERAGIAIVGGPADADWIAARRFRDLTAEAMGCGKPAIAWTHEPFFTGDVPPIVRNHLGGANAYIFSVWNRNVYLDSWYYAPPTSRRAFPVSREMFEQKTERGRAVVFAKHGVNLLSIGGREVSLYPFRSQLALDLRERGVCDIHGLRWPHGVALGQSRDSPDRTAIKVEAFARYPFTLCSENSLGDHYVTERIWEAVEGGCLPIYWPNEASRADLPPDSFLDLSTPEISTPDKIAAKMRDMSADEWRQRMNRLVEIHNIAAHEGRRFVSRRKAQELLIGCLRGHMAMESLTFQTGAP